MKGTEWRRLVIGLAVIWLLAIAMAWALSGCAQTTGPPPLLDLQTTKLVEQQVQIDAALEQCKGSTSDCVGYLLQP